MDEFFCYFGIATLALIGILIIWLLVVALIDLLHELKWKYTYKHRFDKPPTAKCYCKDCMWHGTANQCENYIGNGRMFRTSDEWFC